MTVQEILAAIEAEQVVMKGILAKENLSEEQEKELETRGEKIKGLQTRAKHQATIDETDRNKPGVLITEKRGDTADLEWRTKCQEFSLRKAVLQATGQRVDAGAEIEVSEEIARRSGTEPEGMSVPWDVFKIPVSNELRATASNISTALPSRSCRSKYHRRQSTGWTIYRYTQRLHDGRGAWGEDDFGPERRRSNPEAAQLGIRTLGFG